MSLRLQLLAFGLLTLVLPWAGLRFVHEMEAALRAGLESSLVANAAAVAAALESELAGDTAQAPQRTRAGATIYAHALASGPQIDGRRDDWRLGGLPGLGLDDEHRVWAGTYGRFAYIVVEADDQDVVYQSSPGRTPHGDRIVLLLDSGEAPPAWLVLATGAPGAFRAQYTQPGAFAPTGRFEDRVVAAWHEERGGFTVEARIPLGLTAEALGVAIVDVDVDADGDGYAVRTIASWDAAGTGAGAFVHRSDPAERVLARFARAGDRYRALDRAGWVVADAGGLTPLGEDGGTERARLTERFFRYVLRREDPAYSSLEQPPGRLADEQLRHALAGNAAVAWYRDGPDERAIVAAAVPITGSAGPGGAVLLEQASEPILTLANQALLRLVTLTVSISVIAAIGLVAYASLLSFRVRRLAQAAESALGPRGEINVALPGRAARDELGDLARSFADLLGRLRDYTQYLRTLTGKLAHELRTPLAIVSTSLDNLEQEIRNAAAAPYLKRLRDGTARLDSILVAMSDATRIEQAIDETVAEDVDLAAVVRSCATAYADVYKERRIVCRVRPGTGAVRGSSELVAQLLDKLVENAVSFSPSGSTIAIELGESAEAYTLAVSNTGPPLPAAMRHQLFDSLVSVRPHGDGRPHLGLGLYVVALIAKFHGARAEAHDLEDGSGVVFRVHFPRGFPAPAPSSRSYRRRSLRKAHARAAEPAVSVRILREVLLMVVLGVVELARGQDLRGDLPVASRAQARLIGGAASLRLLALRVGVSENRGAVLRSDIGALPHPLRRIVRFPKRL